MHNCACMRASLGATYSLCKSDSSRAKSRSCIEIRLKKKLVGSRAVKSGIYHIAFHRNAVSECRELTNNSDFYPHHARKLRVANNRDVCSGPFTKFTKFM